MSCCDILFLTKNLDTERSLKRMAHVNLTTTDGIANNELCVERNQAVIIFENGVLLYDGCTISTAQQLIQKANHVITAGEDSGSNYFPFPHSPKK